MNKTCNQINRMICNNCGSHMSRSIIDFNATICHDCGMKHIWPESACNTQPENTSNLVIKKISDTKPQELELEPPIKIEDLIECVFKDMPDETKSELILVEERNLISLHNNLGRFIRNKYGLWHRKVLKGKKELDADESSNFVIRIIWKRIMVQKLKGLFNI